jgi:hypothetical protein
MRLKSVVLVAAALALTGCYHVVVETNAQPSGTEVKKGWQATWIYGLIPASEVSVAGQCPNGASKVETQNSPVNVLASLLAGAVTFGIATAIWTPHEVKVTCAK